MYSFDTYGKPYYYKNMNNELYQLTVTDLSEIEAYKPGSVRLSFERIDPEPHKIWSTVKPKSESVFKIRTMQDWAERHSQRLLIAYEVA